MMRDYQIEIIATGECIHVARAPMSLILEALQVGSVPMDASAPARDAFEDRLRLELEIRALGLREAA